MFEEWKRRKAERAVASAEKAKWRKEQEEAELAAAYAAAKARQGRKVEVTNGFDLGFSIFWGFFVGGLIVAIGIFFLNLIGCGILLGL